MENLAICPPPVIRTSALLFQLHALTSLLRSSTPATPGLTRRLTTGKHVHWRACLLKTSKLLPVRSLLKSTWRDQYLVGSKDKLTGEGEPAAELCDRSRHASLIHVSV